MKWLTRLWNRLRARYKAWLEKPDDWPWRDIE